MLEHRDQVRICPVVVDQKTRINRIVDAVDRDIDGVSMTSELSCLLEQRHLMRALGMLLKQPCARKPGDARTDDGNFHSFNNWFITEVRYHGFIFLLGFHRQ